MRVSWILVWPGSGHAITASFDLCSETTARPGFCSCGAARTQGQRSEQWPVNDSDQPMWAKERYFQLSYLYRIAAFFQWISWITDTVFAGSNVTGCIERATILQKVAYACEHIKQSVAPPQEVPVDWEETCQGVVTVWWIASKALHTNTITEWLCSISTYARDKVLSLTTGTKPSP